MSKKVTSFGRKTTMTINTILVCVYNGEARQGKVIDFTEFFADSQFTTFTHTVYRVQLVDGSYRSFDSRKMQGVSINVA